MSCFEPDVPALSSGTLNNRNPTGRMLQVLKITGSLVLQKNETVTMRSP
jgi:hypothetical protein